MPGPRASDLFKVYQTRSAKRQGERPLALCHHGNSAMLLNRRNFVLGALAVPASARKERPAARPNVVLIVSDGLGSWMLGCAGNREIRTPNIDQLAQAGVRFQNHLACTPASSPGLATLFTGRVPRQHGIQDFLTSEPIENPPQGQAAVPPSFHSEVMLSDLLTQNGYECGYAGNWQLGDDQTSQHGCKFWYVRLPETKASYQNPRMSWNGQAVAETGCLTELITAKAAAFLDRQTAGRPFFLTVSYPNPRSPYEGLPPKYYEMYAKVDFTTTGWEPAAAHALRDKNFLNDIVGNSRKNAAAVTALDDQIPLLLNKLHQRGLREDTLIVFTSAAGYLLGRHGLWSDGLASDPINMYEEVVQTPMIWHWPGRVPVESVRPELVSAYDFVPAVCELLEVPLPAGRNLCGRSYLPLVLNKPLPKKTPWRTVVFGQYRNTEMTRDRRFKLVLRNGGNGPNELFDLANDARERVNLYENENFLQDRAQLTRELDGWRKATSA